MEEELIKLEKQFNEYSANLTNYLPEFQNVVLCPYCLREFSKKGSKFETSDGSYLTEAHILPKALAGRKYVLACNVCNSNTGKLIDSKFIDEYRQKSFLEGKNQTKERGFLTVNGSRVNGDMTLNPDQSGEIIIAQNRSNPKNIEKILEAFLTGNVQDISVEQEFKPIDNRLVQLGMLNTAFLRSFEYFGYPYILSEAVHKIRLQLMSPNKEIIDEPFCFWEGKFNYAYEDLQNKIIIIDDPILSTCLAYNFEHMTVLLPLQKDGNLTIYSKAKEFLEDMESHPTYTTTGTTRLKAFVVEDKPLGHEFPLKLLYKSSGQEKEIIISQPDLARKVIQARSGLKWEF